MLGIENDTDKANDDFISAADVGLDVDSQDDSNLDNDSNLDDENDDNLDDDLNDDVDDLDADENADDGDDTDDLDDGIDEDDSLDDTDDLDDEDEVTNKADDEDHEFDYLIPEIEEERKKEAEAAKAKDEVVPTNAEDWEKSLDKRYIPGTKEYFDAIRKYADQAEEADENFYLLDEEDQADRRAYFKSKAKEIINDTRADTKKAYTRKVAVSNADAKLASILNTPELNKAYSDALDNMKTKHFRDIQSKAQNGDFDAFFRLANKIASVKGKVKNKINRVNNRGSKPKDKGKRRFISKADEIAKLVNG